jgi:hypothetical protein
MTATSAPSDANFTRDGPANPARGACDKARPPVKHRFFTSVIVLCKLDASSTFRNAHGSVDPRDETGEHPAGPTSISVSAPAPIMCSNRFSRAQRALDLPREETPHVAGIGQARHVGIKGHGGLADRNGPERATKRPPPRRHERGMKAAAGFERDRFPVLFAAPQRLKVLQLVFFAETTTWRGR